MDTCEYPEDPDLDSWRRCRDAGAKLIVRQVLDLQGRPATAEAVAACTRELVTRSLFAGRDLLGDGDDHPLYRQHMRRWVVHAAVWLGDEDLLRRLCSEWGKDTLKEARGWQRSVDLAGGSGALAVLSVVRGLLSPDTMFRSGIDIRDLLVRACVAGNADVFAFALDRADEAREDMRRLVYHGRGQADYDAIKRCPSVACYRRLTRASWASRPHPPPEPPHRRLVAALAKVVGHHPEATLLKGDESGAQRVGFAAMRGNLEMVRYFVDGAVLRDNPAAMWPDKLDPGAREAVLLAGLLNAVAKSHMDVVCFLLDRGAPITARVFQEAVHTGTQDVVRLLVERGADVNAGVPPPISLAVYNEDMYLFRYLLDHGALLTGGASHAGAWGLVFARRFGLDTMQDVLAENGVPRDASIHWVLSRDEARVCPPIWDYCINPNPWQAACTLAIRDFRPWRPPCRRGKVPIHGGRRYDHVLD